MDHILQNITIIGAGTQGSMLAFRSAAYGRKVTLYDIRAEALTEAMEKMKRWFDDYVTAQKRTADFAKKAFDAIETSTDLAYALKEVELVIENVPEILELKQDIWIRTDELAPANALLTTNSSSLKASEIGKGVKRKEKTFNLNFMTPTKDDLVEVMWHDATSAETKAAALAFLKAQGHVPIITKKEIKGFSLNRVWRAMKKECLKLWAEGYITPDDFDRAFILEWNTAYGPFALMDKVGLDIVRQIEMTYYAESGDPSDIPPNKLDEMIAEGMLGEKTGRGFYEYPNPSYERPDWLKGERSQT